MSKKAQKCRKCGEWFKDKFGNFQVIPENYDPSICPKCNRELDEGEEIRFEQAK